MMKDSGEGTSFVTPVESGFRFNLLPKCEKIAVRLSNRGSLRPAELRIKDIDFTSNQIVIRAGKGDKERHTLPAAVKEPLPKHLELIKEQHQPRFRSRLGPSRTANALDRKYPNAGKEWGWQWAFPATSHYTDALTGEKRRHHLHESVLQRACQRSSLKAGRFQARRSAHLTPFFCYPLTRKWL